MSQSSHTPPTIVFGIPKLPAKYSGIVMPFFLSVLMSMLVSFISTIRVSGLTYQFINLWMSSWAISWLIAFPTLLLILPIVKKITAVFVRYT